MRPLRQLPRTYDELRAEISAEHGSLSKRLRQIAEFALANPNDMALATVSEIAERADVQPSTLIRFAKAFGYDGFTAMQRVFRLRLTEQQPSYSERIKVIQKRGPATLATPASMLDSFTEASIQALRHLREETRADLLDRAVAMLARANAVHVVGQRRAFPVAAYLAYGLNHLGRRAFLVDSVGGMSAEQASTVHKGDALIAISFSPYSPDTLAVTELAVKTGASIIAITDGPLSPLAPLAEICLEVEEAEVGSFRSLSACMCLALTLVVSLGHRMESNPKERRPAAKSRIAKQRNSK
ncbi:MAG: MurR/RpiR family transcriptional regulator [Alphaproteobacteria bacterium]|nr:MurR/RpiR family transcriptional regulator [Alphaproteobacteria bacterium]